MRAWLYMVGGIAAVAPATAVASPRAADASAAPSSDARHAPTGTRAERRVVAPADISGSYFMGAFNGGINFGAAALVRVHAAGMGVEGTAGGALFEYGYAMLAGDTGISWVTEGGFRLDVLGALGADHYSGAGRGFMSSDPGARATLPFAGARVITGYMFFKGTAHLELAARGFFDDDLTRQTVSYDYTETGSGFLEIPGSTVHTSHRVGTWRTGVAFDLICTWDL